MKKIKWLGVIFVLLASVQLFSHETHSVEYSCELSAFTGAYSIRKGARYYSGLRILPFIRSRTQVEAYSYLELYLSANGALTFQDNWKEKLELYRLSLSYQSPQTEVKVGLQKITFGPAKYLRSLMWFDRVNPTDPIGMTSGLYAALFRYYTLNNTNFWFWGLYGNKDLKALETYVTDPDVPEFGGRIQLPLSAGEIAFSYHNRILEKTDETQQRFALDASYDLGIGIWFEAVSTVSQAEIDNKMLTLGADYTFDIGNGLNVISEYMPVKNSSGLSLNHPDEQLFAISFSYPVNLMDQVMYLSYYAKSVDKLFHYLRYQRTYDNLSLNLSLFHYPDVQDNLLVGNESNINGLGIKVMVVYNF